MESGVCAQCGQPLTRKQRISRWVLIALAFLTGLALATAAQPLLLLAHRTQASTSTAHATPHPALNASPTTPAVPEGTLLLN